MFDTWLTYLREGFKYHGLEVCEFDGKEEYCFLEVVRKKKELHITGHKRSTSIEGLSDRSNTDIPLFLTINTSMVLTKQLENSIDLDPEKLVNEAFPDLDLNNFYYQLTQIGHNPIVTITKKEYVDNLIQRLGTCGARLAGLSIGISAMQGIIPFITDTILSLSSHNLEISNDQIGIFDPEVEFKEQAHSLNGLSVPNLYILSFAHIYGHLSGFTDHTNFEPQRDNFLNRFHNRRIFHVGSRFSLMFFLCLLMGNFLLFHHYHDQVGELQNTVTYRDTEKNDLRNLEAKVKKKQERVELLNAGTNSRSTFYLDDIGKGIPQSILLDQLTFLPLAKPYKDSNPIELEENTIWVHGISQDDNAFSSWLESLEKKDWIIMVETMGYDYAAKGASNFSFKITFHEDR